MRAGGKSRGAVRLRRACPLAGPLVLMTAMPQRPWPELSAKIVDPGPRAGAPLLWREHGLERPPTEDLSFYWLIPGKDRVLALRVQLNGVPPATLDRIFGILEQQGSEIPEKRVGVRTGLGLGRWELWRRKDLSPVWPLHSLRRSKSISVTGREFRGTYALTLGKSCPYFWEDF